MTDIEQRLRSTLSDEADDTAPGAGDRVLARVMASRRGASRPRWGVAVVPAVVAVAVAVVVVSALAFVPQRFHDARPAREIATAPTSSTIASPGSPSSPMSAPSRADLPWSQDHPWNGDPNNAEVTTGTTPLSSCPEALAYLQLPEAMAYFTTYYGGPPGPETRFVGGCPSVEYLKRVVESSTPPSPPPASPSS